jgi:hypothetical protein
VKFLWSDGVALEPLLRGSAGAGRLCPSASPVDEGFPAGSDGHRSVAIRRRAHRSTAASVLGHGAALESQLGGAAVGEVSIGTPNHALRAAPADPTHRLRQGVR